MRKKAQMLSQIFVFVMAAIIFLLILMYGYKAISNFIQRSEQVALIDFKTDLESSVEVIKRDYGSVRKIELKLPKEYTDVCIVDPTDPGTLQSDQPLMYAAWQAGSENVFLIPKQEAPIYLADITVNGYECIPVVYGKVTLKLEGLGKKARISRWPIEE